MRLQIQKLILCILLSLEMKLDLDTQFKIGNGTEFAIDAAVVLRTNPYVNADQQADYNIWGSKNSELNKDIVFGLSTNANLNKYGFGNLEITADQTHLGSTVIAGGGVTISKNEHLGAVPSELNENTLVLNLGNLEIVSNSVFNWDANKGIKAIGGRFNELQSIPSDNLVYENNSNQIQFVNYDIGNSFVKGMMVFGPKIKINTFVVNVSNDKTKIYLSTNTKTDQTIVFGKIPIKNKLYSATPFALEATTNSDLNLTYTSSNPNVLTISGQTANIINVGTAYITASQSGNENYNPANSVKQLVTVEDISANENGDLAIIGYVLGNVGENPSVTILFLKAYNLNSTFLITNNAVVNSNNFANLNNTIGTLLLLGKIEAGTVITLPWDSNKTVANNYSWTLKTGSPKKLEANTQLYIYKGDVGETAASLFIYGIKFGSSSSAKPTSLTKPYTWTTYPGGTTASYKRNLPATAFAAGHVNNPIAHSASADILEVPQDRSINILNLENFNVLEEGCILIENETRYYGDEFTLFVSSYGDNRSAQINVTSASGLYSRNGLISEPDTEYSSNFSFNITGLKIVISSSSFYLNQGEIFKFKIKGNYTPINPIIEGTYTGGLDTNYFLTVTHGGANNENVVFNITDSANLNPIRIVNLDNNQQIDLGQGLKITLDSTSVAQNGFLKNETYTVAAYVPFEALEKSTRTNLLAAINNTTSNWALGLQVADSFRHFKVYADTLTPEVIDVPIDAYLNYKFYQNTIKSNNDLNLEGATILVEPSNEEANDGFLKLASATNIYLDETTQITAPNLSLSGNVINYPVIPATIENLVLECLELKTTAIHCEFIEIKSQVELKTSNEEALITDELQINSTIKGLSGFTKNQVGRLILTNTNEYIGNTYLQKGEILISDAINVFGQSILNINYTGKGPIAENNTAGQLVFDGICELDNDIVIDISSTVLPNAISFFKFQNSEVLKDITLNGTITTKGQPAYNAGYKLYKEWILNGLYENPINSVYNFVSFYPIKIDLPKLTVLKIANVLKISNNNVSSWQDLNDAIVPLNRVPQLLFNIDPYSNVEIHNGLHAASSLNNSKYRLIVQVSAGGTLDLFSQLFDKTYNNYSYSSLIINKSSPEFETIPKIPKPTEVFSATSNTIRWSVNPETYFVFYYNITDADNNLFKISDTILIYPTDNLGNFDLSSLNSNLEVQTNENSGATSLYAKAEITSLTQTFVWPDFVNAYNSVENQPSLHTYGVAITVKLISIIKNNLVILQNDTNSTLIKSDQWILRFEKPETSTFSSAGISKVVLNASQEFGGLFLGQAHYTSNQIVSTHYENLGILNLNGYNLEVKFLSGKPVENDTGTLQKLLSARQLINTSKSDNPSTVVITKGDFYGNISGKTYVLIKNGYSIKRDLETSKYADFLTFYKKTSPHTEVEDYYYDNGYKSYTYISYGSNDPIFSTTKLIDFYESGASQVGCVRVINADFNSLSPVTDWISLKIIIPPLSVSQTPVITILFNKTQFDVTSSGPQFNIKNIYSKSIQDSDRILIRGWDKNLKEGIKLFNGPSFKKRLNYIKSRYAYSISINTRYIPVFAIGYEFLPVCFYDTLKSALVFRPLTVSWKSNILDYLQSAIWGRFN